LRSVLVLEAEVFHALDVRGLDAFRGHDVEDRGKVGLLVRVEGVVVGRLGVELLLVELEVLDVLCRGR
jgi:hypothetical protein